MKDIYQAVRALVYPKNAAQQVGSRQLLGNYPWVISEALRNFELHNRGHQQMLSTDAVRSNLRIAPEKEGYARYQKARATILALVDAFGTTSLEAIKPSPALDAVLDAQDDSGWVREYVCTRLDMHVYVAVAATGRKEFEVHNSFAEPTSIGVLQYATIRVPQLRMMAQRKFQLPPGDLSTIRSALAYLHKGTKILSEELATVRNWPEFSTTSRDSHIFRLIQEDLRRMVASYSEEQRAVLAKDWDRLCPVPRQGKN